MLSQVKKRNIHRYIYVYPNTARLCTSAKTGDNEGGDEGAEDEEYIDQTRRIAHLLDVLAASGYILNYSTQNTSAPLASRADWDHASPVYPPRAALSARARHCFCGRQTVTRGLAERGCGRGVGRRRRCRRGRVDGRALAASLDEGGGLDALCGVDDGGGRWHLRLCFRLCLALALALIVKLIVERPALHLVVQ